MGSGFSIYCKECYPNGNNSDDVFDTEYYNAYELYTGGGVACCASEQLTENYKEVLNNESDILNEVKGILYNGFEFREPVGFLPYYCEHCKILDNKYYFEMKKGIKIYVPGYKCKICNNKLKSAVFASELEDEGSWAYDLKKHNAGNLIINDKGDKIKIIDKENNEYMIQCRKCGNNVFHSCFNMFWD